MGVEYIDNDGTKTSAAGGTFVHTVTSAEQTAEIVALDVSSLVKGTPSFWQVQIYRAGVLVGPSDAVITATAGTLTITEAVSTPTYEVTTGDIVMVKVAGDLS